MKSRAFPAQLPPAGLPGLNPAWSRLVTATDSDGVDRTWHVLDNRVERATATLLCVHGNPTWSYFWRDLVAGAPAGVRVIAVDHLDMGYSEYTGQVRRLARRIEDLQAVADALNISGPVVVVAHDWGGPISLGWAARNLSKIAGVVLMNTAVHQPAGSPVPGLIRVARSKAIRDRLCVQTQQFIKGALRLVRNRLPRAVRRAYLAPYATAARRHAIGTFVADIPLEPDHPSAAALQEVVAGVAKLGTVPALLLWGPSDPVFSDRYLRGLHARLPQAAVHRFVGASHLVAEDADIAEPLFDWLAGVDVPPAIAATTRTQRESLWAGIERRRAEGDDAVIEMAGAEPSRRMSFAELAERVETLATGFAASGIGLGDRVSLLIPPGIDLTVCLYACWRAGAVPILADAGLGASGMSKALQSATPRYLIGNTRALAAARSLRWPGKRISIETMPALQHRTLGVWSSLDQIRAKAEVGALPRPPGDDDVAIVVFTSGATGPAKGVTYRHHQAQAQRDTLMQLYGITGTDRLVAAFAPFALYGPAMGIASVVPDMNVTAPGTLTASALGGAAAAVDATLVFASPAALVNVIATGDDLSLPARHALAKARLLMSAGAPISAELLRRVAELVPNAELHTPYGMTEVLPVADISLDGIDAAGEGYGVCVGKPVPGAEVAIAPLDDVGVVGASLTDATGVVGEVCIRAPHGKDEYDKLWATQRASSLPDGWHRSGDVGHLDEEGRLWIEGRLIHVITTASGVVTPVGVEHAVEAVADVKQAAAVGVGPTGTQQVVVVVVTDASPRIPRLASEHLADQIRGAVNVDIAAVFVASSVPVDKRHNSKIDRTKIAAWAEAVLAGERMRPL